ncbi:MAG: hypothetical protein HZA54_07360, partial [Planctomycetes bacterium]|nr:hypothetical protein [Planctomycetota bacterium]
LPAAAPAAPSAGPPPAPALPAAPRRSELLLFLHFLALAACVVTYQAGDQVLLMRGDHGRDLDCFARVAAGERPYQDFQWLYGPLMLYLYAGAYQLFGASVLTVRWTFLLLTALGAALAGAAARRPYGPVAAHAVAFAVLLGGAPLHTYNHVGILVAVAVGTWAVLDALEPGPLRRRSLAGIAGAGLLAGLVKWTTGVAWVASASLVVLVARLAAPRAERAGPAAAGPAATGAREDWAILAAAVAALGATAVVYLAWLLPAGHQGVRIWLDHLGERDRGSVLGDMLAWPNFLRQALIDRPDLWAPLVDPKATLPFLLLVGGTLGAAWLLHRAARGAPWNAPARRLLALWFLSLLLSHEFLSFQSVYSLAYMSSVPVLWLAVALLDRLCDRPALASVRARLRSPGGVAAVGAAWMLVASLLLALRLAPDARAGRPCLTLPRGGGVRILSDRQREELEAVARYVNRATEPGEAVAVFPYDLLISFLADRPSPLYPTMLLAGYRLDPASQVAMVDALETRPVRCLVISNNSMLLVRTSGFFGYTHLGNLSAYITNHYAPVAAFGFDAWHVPMGIWDSQSIVYWRKGAEPPVLRAR